MDARGVIAGLRRREPPDPEALRWFARGLADGRVSDAQAGAFAMAVCMGGLDDTARAVLTLAMRDTGDVMRWDLGCPILDKHSTGGLGDCVSLVLAPALAACGGAVPMISGRGLGHTGGTLDKLEAIPGVFTAIDGADLRAIVGQVGCAIVGATARIAPADKRLYAIRDVTATVESVDLITASILAKKLAAAPDALVLDVKVGSGAFMKTSDAARDLARALTATATAAGCRATAVISDMNQPLAPALGNALEVAEALGVLCDARPGPLRELSAELGGALLRDAGLADDARDGAGRILRALDDGRAAERFARMIVAQGGPAHLLENWRRILPRAPVIREVHARVPGHVAAIDGEALGLAVVALGGGRQVETDTVDPSVGFSGLVRLADRVGPDTPLAVVHAADTAAADAAETRLRAALRIMPEAADVAPLIHAWVG